MRYGGKAPLWVLALQLAEVWGVPPWIIMEQPGGLRWLARWQTYQEARARSREMDS